MWTYTHPNGQVERSQSSGARKSYSIGLVWIHMQDIGCPLLMSCYIALTERGVVAIVGR
jgi:hypothetical protein